MATPAALARGWMQKGDSDRLNADRTAHTPGPYDTACFHCQQAVEKFLKAVLAAAG
jgi:HEPN domain-containing protein